MSTQAAFSAALLDIDLPCPDGLCSANGADPASRFAVYRNNVQSSLINALADSYPVVVQLVGDEFFRAMAGVFVQSHPPHSPLMSDYGSELADFISKFGPAASVPYLAFQRSTIDEAEFIREVIRRTGCGLLLDVNNVYVSCINHQRAPLAYLDALPLHAVGEIHLAGFAEDSDSLGDRLLIDDHGAPIDQAVWSLYRKALERVGPVATLIERDNQVPAFNMLLAEAQQADELLLCAGGRP